MVSDEVFNLIWSLGAIALGTIGVFYTDWYIKHSQRWLEFFSEKTGITLYRWQAKQIGKPYMAVFVKVIGGAFIVLGLTLLLGFWHPGPE